MPLSDREREMLAQIERALSSDDPGLARHLVSGMSPRQMWRNAVGALLVLAGLGGLLAGVMVPAVPVGVLGFCVQLVGLTMLLRVRRSRREESQAPGPASR